jgi:preprotein translocase subunit SecA
MVEKSLLLQLFDQVWKEHLLQLDHLRQGIGLRAYGQRDPLNEYKSEAFVLFNSMLEDLRVRVTSLLMRVELRADAPPPMPEPVRVLDMRHPSPDGREFEGEVAVASRRMDVVDPNDPATWASTPRNAACPCGSGKKYKHCHGRA